MRALLSENVLVPAGVAHMGDDDFDVIMNDSPDTIEAFNAMPVRVVQGATVHLGDVARVHDGYATQENIVRVDGRRATYLTVLRKANASTIAVVDAARSMIPAINAAAPEGVDLTMSFDQSVFVRATLRGHPRGGAVVGAGLLDDPALPRELAEHDYRRDVDPIVDFLRPRRSLRDGSDAEIS